MSKLVVVGAGSMGLAAAYFALQRGHQVEVFEADDRPGGMAAHFDFAGLSIERYYHFVCKTDQPTFDLMAELGISDRLHWKSTSMSYFIDGRHYTWGNPIALLRFPLLGLVDKLRYGLQIYLTTRARSLDHLELVTAEDWIVGGSGRRVYDLLWKRLFELKFYQYADNISAAWIASRVKRIGRSRKSILQEEIGYIDGGTETLIGALAAKIEAMGGRIHLSSPVQRVEAANGRVTGVRVGGELIGADQVIATIPTPLILKMAPDLSPAAQQRYRAIRNIGVVCVVLKLKKQVTQNFWLNINDANIPIPGVIEFSNLRPMAERVVFVPYYMPHNHPKWGWSDAEFVAECMAAIHRINPDIGDDDLIASHVGRLTYAQPICEAGFLAKIPPILTEIAGLQIADTSFYYPEDRGIAESILLGRQMAEAVT